MLLVGIAVGAALRGLIQRDSSADAESTPTEPSLPAPAVTPPAPVPITVKTPTTTVPQGPHRIILLDHQGRQHQAEVMRKAYRVFHDGQGWDHVGQDRDGCWIYVRTDKPQKRSGR
jgi:hypothetical protein